jgi:hypothetical protein
MKEQNESRSSSVLDGGKQEIMFPCPIHGDPRKPEPDFLLATWIYSKMPKVQRQEKNDMLSTKPELRINEIEILLRWCNIGEDFSLYYLELISLIHNAFA